VTVFLYFGFLYVFFGIIVAVLYMLKSSPSKKKKITKKKEYFKPTKKEEKKINKYLNKNTIFELSKVFLFILIAFPFFVISPLMGISVVFIAAVWYSLLQGDFWR
tara:strand:- start:329 stop:643 length:315 start_codon:yes stop_codon:yes gene_type:complete